MQTLKCCFHWMPFHISMSTYVYLVILATLYWIRPSYILSQKAHTPQLSPVHNQLWWHNFAVYTTILYIVTIFWISTRYSKWQIKMSAITHNSLHDSACEICMRPFIVHGVSVGNLKFARKIRNPIAHCLTQINRTNPSLVPRPSPSFQYGKSVHFLMWVRNCTRRRDLSDTYNLSNFRGFNNSVQIFRAFVCVLHIYVQAFINLLITVEFLIIRTPPFPAKDAYFRTLIHSYT